MPLFQLAPILFLFLSHSSASEVWSPILDYGTITLTDVNHGLRVDVALHAPRFTMYSFRLVNNCQQRASEHPRARQPLTGSILTNREGYGQSTRIFHRMTIKQLQNRDLNAVVFYVHDHNSMRFLTCSDLKSPGKPPELHWTPEQPFPFSVPDKESPLR